MAGWGGWAGVVGLGWLAGVVGLVWLGWVRKLLGHGSGLALVGLLLRMRSCGWIKRVHSPNFCVCVCAYICARTCPPRRDADACGCQPLPRRCHVHCRGTAAAAAHTADAAAAAGGGCRGGGRRPTSASASPASVSSSSSAASSGVAHGRLPAVGAREAAPRAAGERGVSRGGRKAWVGGGAEEGLRCAHTQTHTHGPFPWCLSSTHARAHTACGFL